MKVITVLGGYGIFGSRVSAALSRTPGSSITVRIAGRNTRIGANFAHRIGAEFLPCDVSDIHSIRSAIDGSHLVVHSAGPFQGADYRVAETCLDCGAHYLDLADGREFVAGIGALSARATERGLLVVSGVSSAPGITSAMIESLRPEFSETKRIQIALSPGNQNPRGAATVGAVLSYLGRRICVYRDGQWIERPGWGDVRRLEFPPPVGWRRVHNCDVPDLELFPAHFGARTVTFSAGLELDTLNYLLSACRWPARLFGLKLARYRRLFTNLSLMLFPFGSTNGSLAVWMFGKSLSGASIERRIAIVTDYDGPATPSSAAVVLARKIVQSGPPRLGAFPCLGFFSLDEVMEHLQPLGIWCARGDASGWWK